MNRGDLPPPPQRRWDVCVVAVKQNGWALLHVREQTPPVCLAAVRNRGYVLSAVKKQTVQICRAAVAQCPTAIRFVNEDLRRKL